MMTTRYPRIRRSVDGIGFVQIATGAKNQRDHERRIVLFDDLVADSQIDVIRALLEGRVTWGELLDARRRHELKGGQILTSVALNRPLLEALRESVSKMGRSTSTRKRYAVTLKQIERSIRDDRALWTADAEPRVRGLVDVHWVELHDHWRMSRSAADWNHVARFFSAFLTKYLGHKHHPFALEVRSLLPRDAEEERVPDLTPGLFWRILDSAAEHVRPAFMALLLTGARDRSEYLRMTREHLMPERCAVRLPGSKTRKSQRVVAIPEEYWPWIDAAVPAPLGYKWLRLNWIRACVAAGAGSYVDPENAKGYVGLRMHDLRHALGQWAADANVPLDRIMDVLGHTHVSTTTRYTRVTSSTQVARAAGDALRKAR